jgi:glycosyltransferase involved in cell wall biosynthesis
VRAARPVARVRILFCPTHYLYGAEREGSEFAWAFNIADRIATLHPDSAVVTGYSEVGRPYRIVALMPKERTFKGGELHALRFNTAYTLYTIRALRRGQFHLVHHVLPFALGRTYNAAIGLPRRETPFVIGPIQSPLEVPDVDLDAADVRGRGAAPDRRRRRTPPAAARVLAALSDRTLRSANRVVTVDERTREAVLARGVAAEHASVIPPGVDTVRFGFVAGGAKPARPLRLLVVANLVARKDVPTVLRAFAEIRTRVEQTHLSIVGEGPQLEGLRRLAGELGIAPDVTFSGAVPHARVHAHYRAAHIFVNASRAEGFASTCLESMASGLPVVSTAVGGFRDMVRDGSTGFLVPENDPRALADRVLAIARDASAMAAFGRRARETAERFDWERAIVPRYLEVYAEALAGARRRRGREAG